MLEFFVVVKRKFLRSLETLTTLKQSYWHYTFEVVRDEGGKGGKGKKNGLNFLAFSGHLANQWSH